MSERTPAVSVVVATHDRPERLAALLESLRGQSLDVDSFEVVVVDDGSGPDTAAVLERERDREGLHLNVLSRSTSAGPAVARNEGWRAARAPVVAFTDDDCEATATWLADGLAACDRAHGTPVQGQTEPNPRELDSMGPFTRTLDIPRAGPFYQTCNIFYPRELLERLGGFDESYPAPGGEDTDLAWRTLELGLDIPFAEDAVVLHAVEDLGPAGHLRVALRWSDAMYLFRRHPELRRQVFSYRVFWKESHALLAQAVLAVALARRTPPAALFALPYARHLAGRCASSRSSPAYAPYLAFHDAVETFAAVRGAIRRRVLVI